MTIVTDRTAWLRERQSGVFATDAAGIAGVGYLDAAEVYAEKTAAAPIDREPNMRMLLGNELEPFVGRLYAAQTGLDLDAQPFRTVRHPDQLWRGCSPDGFAHNRAAGVSRLAQFKCVFSAPSDAWGEPFSDEIPDGYLIQVQHELDVCLAAGVVNDPVADVGVLFVGYEFRVYRVGHSPALLGPLVGLERDFWHRVQTRAGIDGWESPLRSELANRLAALRPDTSIDLGELGADLVGRYEDARAREKDAKGDAEMHKAAVLALLDGVECGRLPDGRRVRQKVVHRNGYTVEPTNYLDFRIFKAAKGKA